MSAPSKLAIVLAVVFVVSVMALIAQLVCIKWRQGRFRKRSAASAGDRESNSSVADVAAAFYSPSKELLYFFCWKNQSTRVEPDGRAPPEATRPSTTESEEDIEDIVKWHGTVFGHSRFLFTIKEDQEREVELESVDGVTNNSSGSCASAPPVEVMKRMSLRECLEVTEDVPAAQAVEANHEVAVTVVPVDTTPFSTPCASPTYFTPTPSPARGRHVDTDDDDAAAEEEIAVAGFQDAASEHDAEQFITLDIHGAY